MNGYSPFLKFKNGELTALFNLSPNDIDIITPLLEIPRDDSYTNISLITRIDNCAKKMKKKMLPSFSFYIDNLEVPDSIKIFGDDNYNYLLNSFRNFDIIPVVGFDRVETHNNIGISFANNKSKKIAIRITQDYFENFLAYKNDLDIILENLNLNVLKIIILDCNYIEDDKMMEKCKNGIIRIIEYINKKNIFSKIIISGSSIPSPISDKVKTGTYVILKRNEIQLYKELTSLLKKSKFTFGDYTVVSPGYAEINIEKKAMLNVITPKIIYSILELHYVIRGYKIKTHKLSQYFTQAETIIKERFFRGKDNSWGDKFLFEKATYKGTNIVPSSIIGPTVNAHIKFMIEEIKKGSI